MLSSFRQNPELVRVGEWGWGAAGSPLGTLAVVFTFARWQLEGEAQGSPALLSNSVNQIL